MGGSGPVGSLGWGGVGNASRLRNSSSSGPRGQSRDSGWSPGRFRGTQRTGHLEFGRGRMYPAQLKTREQRHSIKQEMEGERPRWQPGSLRVVSQAPGVSLLVLAASAAWCWKLCALGPLSSQTSVSLSVQLRTGPMALRSNEPFAFFQLPDSCMLFFLLQL